MSLGQLGGVLFFQIFGQLMARGSYLARRDVPFAGTVLITGQERIAAALVSLSLAAIGAAYLFGKLTFELAAGGADFIRICLGLCAASSAVYWVWQDEIKSAVRGLTRRGIERAISSVAFSAAVQLWTMIAYVSVAHALAPQIALIDLAAAISLVMFAASIPISFAGWGVREMSAVAALGAVGMPNVLAVTVAVLIGALSIACAGLLSMSALTASPKTVSVERPASPLSGFHSDAVLKAVPVLTAMLVFFQIHIPTQTATLNVNLADPFAILGGVLFLLSARRALPQWRLSYFNAHILACTGAMLVALLIGATQIGWTDWAVTNRFLGWFVLLAYGATGALAGRFDLRRVLDTFVGAGSAVVAFQVVDVALSAFGITTIGFVTGFAQNTNAFAFQCLMLLCVALATRRTFSIAAALCMVGIWISGSRAGVGSAVIVMATALIFRPSKWRLAGLEALAAIAAVIVLSVALQPGMTALASLANNSALSNAEHLNTVIDGLHMFAAHPVFGAGLGVFIDQWKGPYPLAIHSTSIWLLAEFGIVGAVIFIAPVVRMFAAEMPRPYGTRGLLVVLVIAAFASMSIFHELLYQRTMWLLLGAALAVSAGNGRQDNKERLTQPN